MNFSNQTVIVTGGTRGIGRGISEAFLKAGGTVIATYAGNDLAADKMKEDNAQYADCLHTFKCDVRDEAAVIDFYKWIEDKFPKIEILINNSGIRRDQVTAMMSMIEWNDVIATNLTGTFLMSKHAVLQFMKNRYGRIVNMSSIGGSLGLPGQANYAASKAGLIGLTQSLAKECASRNINVNAIAPGFIQTRMTDQLSEEMKLTILKQIPNGRFGSCEDVSNCALFLASSKSNYINGQVIQVDGGMVM